MELVHNCLKVQGGIIVPVYNVEPEMVKQLSDGEMPDVALQASPRGACYYIRRRIIVITALQFAGDLQYHNELTGE
jgi:hypothetical protein